MHGLRVATSVIGIASMLTASQAMAREAPEGANDRSLASAANDESASSPDIVVTARRRAEKDINVPIAITAVSAATLEKTGTNTLMALSRLVPQLNITTVSNGQGGLVSFRGVASATESNNLSDQAVSFNVDGAQISRATIARMAQFDLAGIEVLKGPQALFYGKNSPGGVIALHTADPTSTLEVKGNLGYEFVADELRGEAAISTPMTETLGVRVAVAGTTQKGWLNNIATPTAQFPVHDNRLADKEIMGRVTLKFTPSEKFNARLKWSYLSQKTMGAQFQQIYCPLGVPQGTNAGPTCVADNQRAKIDLGSNMQNLFADFGDGTTYFKTNQTLGVFEANYLPSNKITITALGSHYIVNNKFVDNYSVTADPTRVIAATAVFNIREDAVELRALTSFGGIADGLVGFYFQNGTYRNGAVPYLNLLAPVKLSDADYHMKSRTYSPFAQLTIRPVQQIEITAGGRYTKEDKSVEVFTYTTQIPVATAVTQRSFSNFSPEISVSWHPASTTTVYANYKEGFLSGGFNAGAGSPAGDRTYDKQTISGFEAGLKTMAFNSKVRFDLTAFSYVVKGLQISSQLANTVQVITNAGEAKSRGFEVSLNWDTPAKGLSFRTAIAYTHARYSIFNAPCFRGQLISEGCNIIPNAAGAFTAQDLAGQQVLRAPDWGGVVAFDYTAPVSSGLELGLSGDMTFSSSYFGDATNKPFAKQDAYQLFNLSARIGPPDGRWQFAVIGRNLSNKYYSTRTVDLSGTGSGTNGTNGPTLRADVAGEVARGREVMVRVSFQFR